MNLLSYFHSKSILKAVMGMKVLRACQLLPYNEYINKISILLNVRKIFFYLFPNVKQYRQQVYFSIMSIPNISYFGLITKYKIHKILTIKRIICNMYCMIIHKFYFLSFSIFYLNLLNYLMEICNVWNVEQSLDTGGIRFGLGVIYRSGNYL